MEEVKNMINYCDKIDEDIESSTSPFRRDFSWARKGVVKRVDVANKESEDEEI